MVRHRGRVARKWRRAVRQWKTNTGPFRRRNGWKSTYKRTTRRFGRKWKGKKKWKRTGYRGKKSSFRRLAKRVQGLPIPAKDLCYDEFEASFGNGVQGADQLNALGAPSTTQRNILMGASFSADSVYMKTRQMNSLAPTGWVIGRSKAIVNSWRQKLTWQNTSNQIMSFTVWTLVCKQDISNLELTANTLGQDVDLLDAINTMMSNQYGATGLSAARKYNHPAFTFKDLAKWSKYFRVAKVKTYQLVPGGMKTLIKFKSRPETINTAVYNSTAGMVCKKGNREYLYRVHATLLEEKEGNAGQLVTPAYNLYGTYHYRFTFLANDQYDFQPPREEQTGLTVQAMRWGNSTKTDLDPAT